MDNIDGYITKDDVYRLLSDFSIYIPTDIRHQMAEKVKALPPIDIKIENWICVKERLPEDDGLYIVCKTVRGYRISFEARWSCKHWLSVVKDMQLEYITHWMPLPEPPKEVRE